MVNLEKRFCGWIEDGWLVICESKFLHLKACERKISV